MISENLPSTTVLPERSAPMQRPAPTVGGLDRAIDLTRLNIEWLLYGALFLLSILLHLGNLGYMAMAHDESVHAYMSWKFFTGRGGFTCAGGLPNNTYCYDPVYHGPTLYVLTFLSFFLFGDSDMSARLPQALSGIALVPMCWLLRPIIGKRAAFVAAVLVTLSPSLLYFSRYARHDALMVLWTMFIVVGLFRWLQSGRIAELVLAAAGLALAWATHELVFILGFIGVTFFAYRWLWEYRPRYFQIITGAAIALGAAVVIATALATSGSASYKLLQRLLGPAMLFGGGALLALLLSRVWAETPLVINRFRATWRSRGNAQPDRPATIWGTLPAALWWAVGAFLVVFGLLFSTFLAYPRGFFDGFYRGLQYWWLSQHEYARGGQPWFYYFMLLPVYDLLATLVTIGGLVSLVALLFRRRKPADLAVAEPGDEGSTQVLSTEDLDQPATSRYLTAQEHLAEERANGNGDGQTSDLVAVVPTTADTDGLAIKRLLVPFTLYWGVLSFIAYSWAGEKMPWLLIHTSLPLTLYAAAVLSDTLGRVPWARLRARRGWAVPLLVILVLVTSLIGAYFLSGAGNTLEASRTQTRAILPLLTAALALFGLWTLSEGLGRATVLRVAGLTVAALLLLYGVRAISLVVYDHPDVPVEPLIYTQTSPDIPIMVDAIRQTAINQSRNDRTKEDPTGSNSMKVVLDNELAWPMQWYLRDFRNLNWTDFTPDQPPPLPVDAPVIMIHTPHIKGDMRDQLAETHVKYSEGVFNWWFPENGSVPDPRDASRQVRAYKELRNDSPLQVLTWPFKPDNWPGLLRFMLYRDIPHKLEGRELELFMRLDVAPVPSEFVIPAQAQPDVANVPLTISMTMGLGELNGPRGLTVDGAGNTYVADALNHRIAIYGPDGKLLRTIGSYGGADGQLNEPSGVTLDAAGNIYVADTWNARIVKLTPDGAFVKSWGSGGDFGNGKRATDTTGDFTQNQANPLGFYGPRNVLVIGDRVYIADTGNKRIVVTDLDGNYVEQFGTYGRTEGQFHEPIGLGKDAQDQLYVGDTWNGRVQVFARDAAQHINPQPVKTFRVRGWSPNTYNDPYLTVTADGRTVVAVPERTELAIYDAAGQLTTRLKDPQVIAPHGLAVVGDGLAVVADGSNRVFQFKLP